MSLTCGVFSVFLLSLSCLQVYFLIWHRFDRCSEDCGYFFHRFGACEVKYHKITSNGRSAADFSLPSGANRKKTVGNYDIINALKCIIILYVA